MNLTTPDIISLRCTNQRLGSGRFKTAAEVVAWQGAVQAQEYHPSLWGLGLRLRPGATKQLVTDELNSGAFVRTWAMRGTIHYVPAKDAQWMVRLLGSRINKKHARYYERVGLTPDVFAVGRRALISKLSGGIQATRKELYTAFEQAGIAEPSKQGRGSFILQYWAQEGLICFGPYRGRQQTFVLLDEWVSKSTSLTHDKALATITKRYFTSHGPATIQDFAYWSGLTIAEAKQGVLFNATWLNAMTIGTKTYWMTHGTTPDDIPEVCLLPCFDEYTMGYKDRGAILDMPLRQQLGYGVNNHVILLRGRIAGTWQPPSTPIDQPGLYFTEKPSATEQQLVLSAIDNYKHFAFQQ